MERVILIPKERVLPEVHTLDSQILNAYKDRIGSYNKSARKVLDVFSDRKGDLAGSNCFAPLKLREFLPMGTRLATMADLGRATEISPGFLRGFYSNTGLTLRTAGDSYKERDFLAKDLANQLKKRGITLASPKIIYFDALDLRKSQDSVYGLAYDLSERAELGENIIDASELMNDMIFKTMNEKGIPIMDNKGYRTLHTRKDGLSEFCLGGLLDVSSSDRDLAVSYINGRVVVVSTEGTRADFNAYLAKLQKTRDEEVAVLQERYAKAEAILRGK